VQVKRRTLGAVLMSLGAVLGTCVAGSGLIDEPRARVLALVCVCVAVGLFATGAALRDWDTGGPTS